jgi:hypothetical protein
MMNGMVKQESDEWWVGEVVGEEKKGRGRFPASMVLPCKQHAVPHHYSILFYYNTIILLTIISCIGEASS